MDGDDTDDREDPAPDGDLDAGDIDADEFGDAKRGTFLVTHADEGSAVLRDVADGQTITLGDNPGVDAEDVVEGVVAPVPPHGVTWRLVELDARRRVDLIDSDLEPTRRATETAADLAVGELERIERAGDGEVHVVGVEDPAAAAADVLGDAGTVERAARLGAARVELRRGEEFLSVRYLPD